jgi:hypothetical protein
MMRRTLRTALLSAPILVVAALTTNISGTAQATSGFTRTITAGGTTTFPSAHEGSASAFQDPEFPATAEGDAADAADGSDDEGFGVVNRSYSGGRVAHGSSVASSAKTKSNPQLTLSFDGLNFRQQRLANGGNQFSVEPPDQGLCAGNGFVLESVNDVLRVFDASGSPQTGVIDLNSFYGYPPAINRSTGVHGPFVTDPSCYYDPAVQRWYHVVLTLDTNPNGSFTGSNHLDIAVSSSPDPRGSWTIYRLPVQDDGTSGTPNHGCSGGPCIGDYPHIGADANGFFVTTNEYSFFGPEFKSAQIYVFSKRALASGAASVQVSQFDTTGADSGNPGFTIWPATSSPNQWATAGGGTEYFLSSNAAEEANGTGTSSRLLLWSITNTASVDSSPALSLSSAAMTVHPYALPPKADQKPGDFPLGQCLNDGPCSTFLLGVPDPFAPEVISHLDANDTRMQQVTYANGKVWGALDTAVTVGGANKAGIEYFVVKPSVTASGALSGTVKDGYLALAGNNLTYPAVGVTQSGRGVIGFTVVGADYYPSAGYAALDATSGAGDIHVAAAGAGPADGFTSYKAFVGDPPRTRWGDYGATAVVNGTVWAASEYVAQTCTLTQYETTPFGSCGGTRASLGNWATRISALTP